MHQRTFIIDGHRVVLDAEDSWRCDCADYAEDGDCEHCARAAYWYHASAGPAGRIGQRRTRNALTLPPLLKVIATGTLRSFVLFAQTTNFVPRRW